MNAEDIVTQTSPPIPIDDHPVLLEQLHETAEKVKAKTTRYEVWQLIEEADENAALWSPMTTVEATSARDAIRQVALQFPQHFGASDVVRAIPVRNITQVTLTAETTTKLRLS